MQYSNNIITKLIEFINKDDFLSTLGIAIRAFDTQGLPVPINETYFSFSCKENSSVFARSEENEPIVKDSLTINLSCFSPLKKSAYSAHNLTEKVISAICSEFGENISGFSIGETQYDDDVKSYKIVGNIYFDFSS
ncbi:MAG: hypothetical protein J6V06_00185 [Clostridia bacterium]|nr:hypothetical protein [Clostridia bacterium]MBO7318421.1 hypothetical protein [Clostridia bacterium]